MRRRAAVAAGALAALVLGPLAAAEDFEVAEQVRTVAGRAGQLSLAGRIDGHMAVAVDGVQVLREQQTIVVELATRPAPGGGLGPEFLFPFATPPLPSALYQLEVWARPLAGGPAELVATRNLAVHGPLEARLEPWPQVGPDCYRLVVAGESSHGNFANQIEVVGKTIRVAFDVGCDLDCASSPPPITTWEAAGGPVGPLTPGVYTVELELPQNRGDQPRIALRQEIQVGPGVDREGDRAPLLQRDLFRVSYSLDPPHHEFTPRLAFAAGEDAAVFYFFSPANWEATVKVLNGCAINGHYWVFGAASTDVGYTLRVEKLGPGGGIRRYPHGGGQPAPALTDTAAFPCL